MSYLNNPETDIKPTPEGIIDISNDDKILNKYKQILDKYKIHPNSLLL